MKFDELSNGWPFMYHCHNLMHEDMMMMLQYVVEDNSTSVADPTSAEGSPYSHRLPSACSLSRATLP
ncbi:MAG: multicopper oxidase domain-containing protein [Flavobacteriales bacterium]|nr:multicopper oxidase domain-containing protein [Flavobacteriales bacterium]